MYLCSKNRTIKIQNFNEVSTSHEGENIILCFRDKLVSGRQKKSI